MEWSLHIASAGEHQADVPEEIERVFGPVRFTRTAYGTEFCEHLLPSTDALRAVVETGRPLTFLTPYLSDHGIAQLRRLLPLLQDAEVVFNDWGVLRLLRNEFPHLTPV